VDVGGYQADCDLTNGYTGICYESAAAASSALRQEDPRRPPTARSRSRPTASDDDLKKARKPAGEWNEYVVICKGNHCVQILNGVVVADFIDDQTGKAAANGILALQLHASKDAMRIEFKDRAFSRLGKAVRSAQTRPSSVEVGRDRHFPYVGQSTSTGA